MPTDSTTSRPHILSHPAWRVVVPLAIFVIALFVLRDLSRDIRIEDVRRDVHAYTWSTLVMSFAAMCVSYLALSFYDVMILRGVTTVRLPIAVPMLTGISSLAVSNLLGFSWLTGGAVRYRIYSAFGIDIAAVAKLIATSWISFLIGLSGLIGVLLLVHPAGLTAVIAFSGRTEIAVGLAMLAAIAGYFIWTRNKERVVGWGLLTLKLPLARYGIVMAGIAVVDLSATALTLYVLLPSDLAQQFAYFFVVYIAAVGLGILSHSPGGLGVFEATLIAGLGAAGRSDVIAALVVYRLIYTILPFLIAVAGLGIAAGLSHRATASQATKTLFRAIAPIVPLVSAAVVMLSGAVLLISGNLPPDPSRLGFLMELLPLGIVETSHLLGSISGVMLMIVARGLYRRMFRAWFVAMALLALGLVFSILKGFDLEAALTLGGALALLWVFRDAFYRADVQALFRLNWRWVLSVSLLVAAMSWIGFFAHSNVAYSDDLWWKFAWKGDASRFLRATLAVSVILAALLLNSLLSKQTTRLRREPVTDLVRNLVASSENATAAIALSGDKRFLIAPDQQAFLAYADTGSTLVSMGDPIGAPDAGVAVIWQLRELADRMGRRCAFYRVSERYLPTYLDLGMQILKTGEIARVPLAAFSLEGSHRKDWRHAKARMGREGYEFAIIPAGESDNHLPAMHTVSDAWLAQKKSHEKGFSLGWFSAPYLRNFDIAVLRHTETGQIAAFANLMRGAGLQEISLDLMRYDPACPGAAMDALFAEMLLWARDQGYHWFSLGAAPLSGMETHRLASTWHRIGSFLYEHGDQFYHFEGLRSYKQKFDPVWSSEYLASPGRLDAARILYEVSLLISRGVKGMDPHDET